MFGFGKAAQTTQGEQAAKSLLLEMAGELRRAADALEVCARTLKNHYAPGHALAASLAKQASTRARRAAQGVD